MVYSNICKIRQQAKMKGLSKCTKEMEYCKDEIVNFDLVLVFVSIGLFLFNSIFLEDMTIWQLHLWNGRLKEVTVIFYLLLVFYQLLHSLCYIYDSTMVELSDSLILRICFLHLFFFSNILITGHLVMTISLVLKFH